MQESKIIRLFKIIPAAVYNGMIWFLSSRTLPVNIGNFDKSLHLIEYCIFGFLLAFAFELTRKNFNPPAKYCIIFGSIAGGIDEFHQYFVPGRSFDIFDFMADVAGIVVGIAVWLLFIKLLSYLKLNIFSQKT
ncbi:MAG: VanZ family protein [Candidatus Gastranaerophilales bacterium]|nr:VanZ family protein [Candidatus Gastranaerophilales bacterium]